MFNLVRQGWRSLRKSPVFLATAVGTLALGIGANTAVFSIVDQVLFRFLPASDPGRLVVLHSDGSSPGHMRADNGETNFSLPMYRDLRDKTGVFSGIAARAGAAVTVSWQGTSERASGELVSGNFFEVFGIRPVAGRAFSASDDVSLGGHPVAMISYAYWQQRFGGNRGVVGQKVLLNGFPMEIVGVLPDGFAGVVRGDRHDVFVPLAMMREALPSLTGAKDRRTMWLNLFGRLKPGVSTQQAETAVNGIFAALLQSEAAEAGMSGRNKDKFLAQRLHLNTAGKGINDLGDELAAPLYTLLGMVGMVLLITCSNLANLLIVRAAGRQREFAVRLALGASRGMLMRQLLLESGMMALAGGLLGLVVARWTLDGLFRVLGQEASFLTPTLDGRVLAFSALAALCACFLFGLLPAWRASRPDVGVALKTQSAGGGSSRGHVRLRKAVLFAQVAMSVTLLAGAGLFARSLYNLKNVKPGFRTADIFTFSVDPSLLGYEKARGEALYQELEAKLAALPEVESVGSAQLAPLMNENRSGNVTAEGYQAREDEETNSRQNYVSRGFFRTLDISLLAGRTFEEADFTSPRKVVVVDESFARRFFGQVNPIGRKIIFGGGRGVVPDQEIVGVVRTAKHSGLKEKDSRMVYYPYTKDRILLGMNYYVRYRGNVDNVATAVRSIVNRMDTSLPVYRAQSMQIQLEQSLSGERLLAILASAFAVLASLLAGMGLYGMMAYSVASRKRDFGIRLALGADGQRVARLVLKEVSVLSAAGIAVGLIGGAALGKVAESALYGVAGIDPAALITAALALAVVGLVAALIPTMRATQIDPATALRYDG